MKPSIVIKMLNWLISALLLGMVIAFITLPLIVNKYSETTGGEMGNLSWIKVFLYVTAIPFSILLVMSKKLCQNILKNNPFSQSSIQSLNVISMCAFLDFFLYTIGTFTLFKNILSLILMIAAFMIGIVSLVLSMLAKLAQEIKEENDLTI
jgi:hypothetical protein